MVLNGATVSVAATPKKTADLLLVHRVRISDCLNQARWAAISPYLVAAIDTWDHEVSNIGLPHLGQVGGLSRSWLTQTQRCSL